MCGIAGYFGTGRLNVAQIIGRLRHRGPDGAGVWGVALTQGTQLQLIHTRLSILDLSDAGAQPMGLVGDVASGPRQAHAMGPKGMDASASLMVVLSFNGEIFNYRELRAELVALGHTFRSSGDTEVLLRGYAEWGGAVFAKLDGIFAVGIYDAAKQRLVLVRDHAGIKPLYFARTHDGGILFASEVRAIASSELWHGDIDRDAVADFLRLGSIQEPRTIWQGIQAFPPGHFGIVELGDGPSAGLSIAPYWLPEAVPVRAADAGAWGAEHAALLRRTVAEQLASDVPIGVFLSSGVDSTLLLEMAAAEGGGRVTAFTVGGAATEANEAEIAAENAKRVGVRHTTVCLSETELGQWTLDGLGAMDQPSADGINTYLVSRAARQAGLVVALGGAGADELHGAYGYGRRLSRIAAIAKAAGPLWSPVSGLAVSAMRWRSGAIPAERLRLLLGSVDSIGELVCERRRFFVPSQIRSLWPAAGIGGVRRACGVRNESAAKLGLREQVRIAEIRGYLLNTLMRDSDWATMANSQELRVPFLGRRYMEFILSAPQAYTADHDGVAKPRLRALLSPEARRLTSLPKRGFVLNYVDLLLGPMREPFIVAARALNQRLEVTVNPETMLKELEVNRSGRYSRRLWALLALGSYLGC